MTSSGAASFGSVALTSHVIDVCPRSTSARRRIVATDLIRQQRTILDESDGRSSSRIRNLCDLFAEAGFPTSISRNVAGWLNAHTAFVVPIAYALYRFDTDAARLAADRSTLRQMVRATRQAFRALQAAGEADIPANLKMLYLRMPEGFAVGYWRRTLAGRHRSRGVSVVAARHFRDRRRYSVRHAVAVLRM
jgi:ketopantoate reductase